MRLSRSLTSATYLEQSLGMGLLEHARVGLHARVRERRDLVEGGGHAHRAFAVQVAVGVAVAVRQGEGKLRDRRNGQLHDCSGAASETSSTLIVRSLTEYVDWRRRSELVSADNQTSRGASP